MNDTIDLLTSIQAVFNSSTALMARYPSGLYFGLQPDSTPRPFVRLVVVSIVPEYDTCSEISQAVVQFDAFTDRTTGGDVAALQGVQDIKQAFDGVRLPLANGQPVVCRRTGEGVLAEDEIVWHAWAQYQILTASQ